MDIVLEETNSRHNDGLVVEATETSKAVNESSSKVFLRCGKNPNDVKE